MSSDTTNASVAEERHCFVASDSSALGASPAYLAPKSAIRIDACGVSKWRNLRLALVADPTGVTASVTVGDRRMHLVVLCTPGGSLTRGGFRGEAPALTQLAECCKRIPPDSGVMWYSCPMHDCLRSPPSTASRNYADKRPFMDREWTVNRFSIRLVEEHKIPFKEVA